MLRPILSEHITLNTDRKTPSRRGEVRRVPSPEAERHGAAGRGGPARQGSAKPPSSCRHRLEGALNGAHLRSTIASERQGPHGTDVASRGCGSQWQGRASEGVGGLCPTPCSLTGEVADPTASSGLLTASVASPTLSAWPRL